jgi:hypothetical protein
VRPVADIVRKLAAEWTDDTGAVMEPWRINSGDCGNFSESLIDLLVEEGYLDAHEVTNECVELGAEDHDHDDDIDYEWQCSFCDHFHVWTWVGGRYYDAEVPDGVENWLDLPFFKRWARRIEFQRRFTREVELRNRQLVSAIFAKMRRELRGLERAS